MVGRSAVLALSLVFFSTASASPPEACDAKDTRDAAKGSAMLQVKFEETHGMQAVGKRAGGGVESQSLAEADNHARRSCVSSNLRKASQIARAKYGDECTSQNLAVGTACTKQGVQGRCTKLTGGQATDIEYTGGSVPNFCNIGQFAACEGKCKVVGQGAADCNQAQCIVLGSITGKCQQTGTTGTVSGNQPIVECKIVDQEPTTKPDPEPTTKPEKPATEAPTTAASEDASKTPYSCAHGELEVHDLSQNHGDVCRVNGQPWECPVGCEVAPGRNAPYCLWAGTQEKCRTAPLDAAGFKAMTSLCCPMETESFFNRLLDKEGYYACSKPHIQGLMHWFTCVPDMDFQYVLDVIANGNPCKFWSPKGVDCPVLSATCQGKWCR